MDVEDGDVSSHNGEQDESFQPAKKMRSSTAVSACNRLTGGLIPLTKTPKPATAVGCTILQVFRGGFLSAMRGIPLY